MDNGIADKVVIPPSSQTHFTEKVVYLSRSDQPNGSQRKVSGHALKRGETGLPPDGFVVCRFKRDSA